MTEENDAELIRSATAGDTRALEALIVRHYDFVYNVAVRLVFAEADALDLTQDIMAKVVTDLSAYREDVNFAGWLYRLTVNHFLNAKKAPMEKSVTTFSAYGRGLDDVEDTELATDGSIEADLLLAEVKVSCTQGMLMCLSRPQRLLYVFGEIFGIDHDAGAYIFETTAAGYRKRLSRARRDLRSFMAGRCGLVDSTNPCSCRNKARGFTANGWVDPQTKTFTSDYRRSVADVVEGLSEYIDEKVPHVSRKVFRDQPYYNVANKFDLLRELRLD